MLPASETGQLRTGEYIYGKETPADTFHCIKRTREANNKRKKKIRFSYKSDLILLIFFFCSFLILVFPFLFALVRFSSRDFLFPQFFASIIFQFIYLFVLSIYLFYLGLLIRSVLFKFVIFIL